MVELILLGDKRATARAIARAASILRQGGLVAFPTETVYGLGANALDPRAVRRVFAVKARPRADPLIVHVLGPRDLRLVAARVPALALRLAKAFWPGPLTLVVPRNPAIPPDVTAGLDTVAVRAPSHPVARALIQAAGFPIAAPSANRFGHISPTTASHVLDDLGDRIDLILDGGPTLVGIESTVVDCTVRPPVVLRPGGLPLEALAPLAPGIRLREGAAVPPTPVVPAPVQAVEGTAEPRSELVPQRSPGQFLRHYAPQARLVVVRGTPELAATVALRAASELAAGGSETVGLLLPGGEVEHQLSTDDRLIVRPLARRNDLSAIAANLYGALREIEATGVNVILATSVADEGMGVAINDRLLRAAGGLVVDVPTAGDIPRAVEQVLMLARDGR